MFRRALRRYNPDIGITVLNRLARQILHERCVFHKIVYRRYNLGRGKCHHGRDRLIATRLQLLGGIDQVGVCEFYLFAAPLKLKKKIIVLDYFSERRTGKTFAVLAHRL